MDDWDGVYLAALSQQGKGGVEILTVAPDSKCRNNESIISADLTTLGPQMDFGFHAQFI